MPSDQTAIEWCDSTWNPVHGCYKVSEGCANCYAADLSNRYDHTPEPWTVQHREDNVRLQEHHLEWPDGRDPERIFVNSMSDLFLPERLLPDEYLHEIMDVVERNPQHAFIALTKHGTETDAIHGSTPRLLEWDRWPENLWMGVSVENQQRAYRIEQLKQTEAAIKWVSFEPLVGPVDPDLGGIDWAVVGGESGPEDVRRPMNHAWARDLHLAAGDAGTAFFFKQSSGPRQGHEPVLATVGSRPAEARDKLADSPLGATVEIRELPPLPEDLAAARPDLVALSEAP